LDLSSVVAMENAACSLPSPDSFIDGTIKALFCLAECENTFEAAIAACFPDLDRDDKTSARQPVDVQACAKAGAALRCCMQMQDKARVYEPYIGGADDLEQQID
jgi:hypothetical protein